MILSDGSAVKALEGRIENDKDLTAREMFLPAVERAATGFGSLRSCKGFESLEAWTFMS